MARYHLQNFYKETVKANWTAGAGTFYVSTKPTSAPGLVVVSPNSSALREIVKYTSTGTDAFGDYIVVAVVGDRGLGGTTAQTHTTNEPVRINITKEHIDDLFANPTFTGNVTVPTPTVSTDAVTKAYADGLANAGAADSSTTTKGISRLSTAPDVTIGVATMTMATPGVVSFTAHGLTLNDIVKFTTTGALPTGVTASTPYYVISAGLTANAFQISATQGGSAINTTGSQSGVHTLIKITPVVVSTTDAKIPTQGQKDAMVGTGTPSTTDPYLNKSTFNTNFIGMVTAFASATPPTGWLSCDGSAVSRTTYASLFAVCGSTYGAGDGSTTFNLPNLLGRSILGTGTGTKVATFSSRTGDVITITGLSNTASNEFQTGQAVLYSAPSGAMTGLTHNTTYYIVRVSNTTFSLATSLGNANANTVISLSSNGTGTQTFTLTLSARTLADTGGEEKHLLSVAEMASHNHPGSNLTQGQQNLAQTGIGVYGGSTTTANYVNIASQGGDTQHNLMTPFVALNYIIKAL